MVRFNITPERPYIVDTNIDFAVANTSYHRRVPPTHSSLSISQLLAHIMGIRVHMNLAAERSLEIATDAVSAEIMRAKISAALDRRSSSAERLSAFQDFLIDDARGIREAINKGDRTMQELLPVVRSASRLKEWIANRQPEADLVKDYVREVTAVSWLDALPARVVRFSVFAVGGAAVDLAIGLPVGVALGIADEFLVDSLLRGWRPSQFVEHSLRPFIRKQ